MDQVPEPELPPLPRVQWAKVLAAKDELQHRLRQFAGCPMAGDTLQSVTDIIRSTLPSSVAESVVRNSLGNVIGATLTEQTLDAIATRFSAQYDLVSTGKPLQLDIEELENFWAAAVVADAWYKWRNGKYGIAVSFRLVTTPAAPDIVQQWWSRQKADYMTNYRNEKRIGFGFGRFRVGRTGENPRGLPYVHPKQLVGLRCFLYLSGRRDGKWRSTTIRHTAATMKYNTTLLRNRDRLFTPCQIDIFYKEDCWTCPIGLDVCGLATHPMTYVDTACVKCGVTGRFSSAESPACETCEAKE